MLIFETAGPRAAGRGGAARWWVHQQATAMARQMVEWMRQKGDTEAPTPGCGSSSQSARWEHRRPIAGIEG
jgi:hypothetical protein